MKTWLITGASRGAALGRIKRLDGVINNAGSGLILQVIDQPGHTLVDELTVHPLRQGDF